jgi:PAS domain S-box
MKAGFLFVIPSEIEESQYFEGSFICEMKAGFVEKLIERLGRIGPEEVQNYFLRLAQEKGFLETVFNAIQEGIIVTDSKGRITYLNEAACGLFGLEGGEVTGKQLDDRIRGLDWESLTKSGGPVSHDMEIFYRKVASFNFYVVAADDGATRGCSPDASG